jgi:hypothetical protein
MRRWLLIVIGLLVTGLTAFSCVHRLGGQADAGWITLLDGSNLDHWNRVGNANWRLAEGTAQADKGNGFLVSKNSYTDFQIRAEFWADPAANSGIFIRCSDPQKISSKNSYEVNIYDKRPDPNYGTSAIVEIAKVSSMPKAADRWNTVEITAKGPQLTVLFNGNQTVDVQDSKYVRGPIALQYAAGVVKFRKLEIRPL